ncbi:hypothetical protein OL548_20465 [Lysinibacillus sp. MHQ-1]|nr:hypothetical protein OL548_20465 [Lysinibacillus sp. MHQ-1]
MYLKLVWKILNMIFSFLVNDITFNEMEEYLVLTGQDVNLEEYTVQAQWVPVVAGALRLLTSKVGKEGMQKGWAIAKPYVKKSARLCR